MEYKAKVPKSNHNVSHKQPLKEILSLLVGIAAFIVMVYVILGFFIDTTVDSISTETEIAIYAALSSDELRSSNESSSEVEKNTRALLTGLLQCSDLGYPIQLGVNESNMVNAYAVPNGDIVLFQGLLNKVSSENGLAFVLAHEIAHFKNRDHLRAMGRTVIIVAISAFFGAQETEISTIMSPVVNFENARYSQQRESKADEIALDILNCHYGHVGGATEFFALIAEPEEKMDFSITHYFSSHPEAENRIT
ncbi:MAG: Zn-dependent protease with chaperone function, partial [Enterobacterales bacterium]